MSDRPPYSRCSPDHSSCDHTREPSGCPPDAGPPDGEPPGPSCPAWRLLGHGTGACPAPYDASGQAPWYAVGLTLSDGAQVEVLAAVVDDAIRVEEVRADPPLRPRALTELTPWLDGPLADACPDALRPPQKAPTVWVTGECVLLAAPPPAPVRGRGRPPGPRGQAARRAVAETYAAARQQGADPVLAVMRLTGHSRRKSLRVIADARDDGLLPPRHARR
ncbi:DUF6214 family protein [Streptomyces reniochalinae]|uniref:DUF6214 family protein n=1 Tax=Streptomyces reniochalinae TaxID=2250578 RepID=UPI001FE9EAF0|nr:DUF6214 family protein [Streptomyces reniochalinae]